MFINENRDRTVLSTYTRLLGLKGNEWVSELIGNKPHLKKDYVTMSKKISGLFLYKGQDKNTIFIEHIASGKKFDLTKKSFDHSNLLNKIDEILFMGIVNWKNEWWFSGIFFTQAFNANLILDEKNSLESRMQVNFLDHQTKETDHVLSQQYKVFLDFNNGLPIAFMPSEKVDTFTRNYMEYFNASLKLSPKEQKAAKQRARDEGFFDTEDEPRNFEEISETALVFFNPKSGVEIAFAINSAFPLPNNPYFEEAESEEHILRLLMDESISVELAMYCIEKCKSKLPFFKEGVGKSYLKDIDFLLRFWKKDSYQTVPSITFTGAKAENPIGG